jgi:hypothetical protein
VAFLKAAPPGIGHIFHLRRSADCISRAHETIDVQSVEITAEGGSATCYIGTQDALGIAVYIRIFIMDSGIITI